MLLVRALSAASTAALAIAIRNKSVDWASSYLGAPGCLEVRANPSLLTVPPVLSTGHPAPLVACQAAAKIRV